MIPKYSNYEEYKKVVIVKNQQEVKFLINDKVFLSGIAEKVQINEKGNEMILSGRSKMILLDEKGKQFITILRKVGTFVKIERSVSH